MSILSDEFYYQHINLDTVNTQVFTNLTSKVGDTNGRGLIVTLTENGLQKDTTGISLNLKWKHRSVVSQGLDNFDVVDLSKGVYKITYPTEMNRSGLVDAFVQIVDSGKVVGTRNMIISVESTVGDDSAIESSNSFTALASALIEVQSWNDRIGVVEQEFIDKANNLDATYPTRLVSVEQQLAEAQAQIDLNKRGLGETFATLVDLQTAYPTGDTKDHIVAADGHRYFWNESTVAWADGGAYQAIELDAETKAILNKTDKAVDETLLIADFFVNKSNLDTAIFTHPTQSWYGWKNGFKPISFRKITLTETVVTEGSTYTMDIMNASSVVLYTKTEVASTVGTNQKITFDFGQLIEMTSDFYISVKSSEFVSFIAAASYNNPETQSATLTSSGWLNGTAWSALGDFSHFLILDFYRDSFKVDLDKVDGLTSAGSGVSMLTGDGTYRTLDDIEKYGITPVDVVSVAPKYVYAVRNDVDIKRNYSSALYVDHFLEGEKILYNKDIRFDNGKLVKPFWSNFLTNTKETETISVAFESNQYVVPSFTTILRKSKLSLNKDKVARVLCIGDSNFYGASVIDYSDEKANFICKLKNLFEFDKIDNSGVGGALLLGTSRKFEWPINYKGETYNVSAATDGRSGWKAYSFANHMRNYEPSQATWDLLGLGNASGTDYTGTQAQKDLIATTLHTYTSEPPATGINVWNPFFDNAKTGSKFSLAKWLSRYRTMDDNGNRLTVGVGTGSLIDATNINLYDVCTPTHIVIQLGQNDIDVGIGNTATFNNTKAIVDSIRAEYPDIIIIIAHSDRPGTMFPLEYGYPGFDCRMTLGGHDKTKDLVAKIIAEYDGFKELENTYYCPNYFTQPNADSMDFNYVLDPTDGSRTGEKVKDFSNSPDAHPSAVARANWAYQIYSLIRWTQ